MEKAVGLVRAGARLIGTNPDVTGPSDLSFPPAGAGCAYSTAGAHPYFVGKPNP
jgi:NagD protein